MLLAYTYTVFQYVFNHAVLRTKRSFFWLKYIDQNVPSDRLFFKSSRFSGHTDSFPGSVLFGRITSSLKLELEHALARTTCDVFEIAYK